MFWLSGYLYFSYLPWVSKTFHHDFGKGSIFFAASFSGFGVVVIDISFFLPLIWMKVLILYLPLSSFCWIVTLPLAPSLGSSAEVSLKYIY